MTSQDQLDIHRQIQKDANIVLDINQSIRLILGVMVSKFHVYDFNMIKDGLKVLNSLTIVNNKKSRDYGAQWVHAMEDLSNIIAVDNSLDWINSYNKMIDSFNVDHNTQLDGVELSCFLKECSDNDLNETFSGSSLKAIKNFHRDLERNNINLDPETHNFMDGKKYMEVFHSHFGVDQLLTEPVTGGFWNLLIPSKINYFMHMAKTYFGSNVYRKINQPFREGIIGNAFRGQFLDMAGTLLFPSKISQELIVYRVDNENEARGSFKCKGYYSTSLRYESNIPFDNKNSPVRILRITIPANMHFIPLFKYIGREGEITLMPGTTLKRQGPCRPVGKQLGNRKYSFCDYEVRQTVDLSESVRDKIFSRIVSKQNNMDIADNLYEVHYENQLVHEIVREVNSVF